MRPQRMQRLCSTPGCGVWFMARVKRSDHSIADHQTMCEPCRQRSSPVAARFAATRAVEVARARERGIDNTSPDPMWSRRFR